MDYENRILVVDDPAGGLQRVALELLRRGHNVHYANDIDEAQLLAQEEHGRIGAVLLAPTIDLTRPRNLARRLAVAPAALVPTGPVPADHEVAALADQGVRWHLFGEPEDELTRCVLASVMSEQDALELRFDLRIPTELPGSLEVGSNKGEVSIRDLSRGGARLLGAIVGQDGDTGHLRFSVDEADVEISVQIAWSIADCGDGVGVAGLCFSEVEPAASEVIDTLVGSIVRAQRIKAGPKVTTPTDSDGE